MGIHEVKLLQREDVARGTTAFHFTWPDGFSFRAGQAVELLLPEVGGHAFSLVNAPLSVARAQRSSNGATRACTMRTTQASLPPCSK